MTRTGQPIRVLIVDDDDALREALADEMSRSGFATTPVADAEAALKETEQRAYDVAIVDLSLPQMQGEELVRELRERDGSIEIIDVDIVAELVFIRIEHAHDVEAVPPRHKIHRRGSPEVRIDQRAAARADHEIRNPQ